MFSARFQPRADCTKTGFIAQCAVKLQPDGVEPAGRRMTRDDA
jgi:hypothetical protein